MIEAPREVHLAIIRKRFPGISLAEMILDVGGEHDVYVVDRSIVFRFPQVPGPIPLVRPHAIAWLAATNAIPFALPNCEIEHDAEFGVWFERARYLPGVPFVPAVAATFSGDEMRTIARQMGEFLTTLHALPLEPARALGMNEMDPADFWDYMENTPNAYPWVRRTLWPMLPPEERAWVVGLFERFIAQAKQTPLPLVIRHNDMQPCHIIVDPDAHTLSGVIDFSWRIADPAGDFKAFEHYGREFVAEVYALYGGTVDPGFEARRLFYTGHDKVFRLVRSYASGDAEAIAEDHAQLSTYVRAPPWHEGFWHSSRTPCRERIFFLEPPILVYVCWCHVPASLHHQRRGTVATTQGETPVMQGQQPVTETRSISEVRGQLTSMVDRIYRREARIGVEKSGVLVAGIVSADDLKRLEQMDRDARAERLRVLEAMRAPFRGIPAEEIERETDRIMAELRDEDRSLRPDDKTAR